MKNRQDIKLSALVAPLQAASSALTLILLYPVIVRVSGLDVLGIWALLTSVMFYLSLTDAGFSITVTRSIGRRRSNIECVEIKHDYAAAILLYRIITIVAILLWLVAQHIFSASLPSAYPVESLVLGVCIVIAAIGQQLVAEMDQAVLAGFNQTYYAKLWNGILPFGRLPFGVYGALAGHPIEGLALGILTEGCARSVLFRARLRASVPSWPKEGSKESWRDTASRLRRLCQTGRHLYGIAIGNAFREPLFRIAIASFIGLPAVAVYELGRRIPDVLRSVVTGGAQSFLAAYASILASDQTAEAHRLNESLVTLLVGSGAVIYSIYYVGCEAFLELWLKNMPADLLIVTKLWSLWCFITIINVPFVYMLQGGGRERIVSLSVWGHTVMIAILFAIGAFRGLELKSVVKYWLISSIVSQIVIYTAFQRYYSALWPPLKSALVIAAGAGVICHSSVWIVTVIFRQTVRSPIGGAIGLAITISMWLAFAAIFRPQNAWRSLNSVRQDANEL